MRCLVSLLMALMACTSSAPAPSDAGPDASNMTHVEPRSTVFHPNLLELHARGLGGKPQP